jgi:hypothetical protein
MERARRNPVLANLDPPRREHACIAQSSAAIGLHAGLFDPISAGADARSV